VLERRCAVKKMVWALLIAAGVLLASRAAHGDQAGLRAPYVF